MEVARPFTYTMHIRYTRSRLRCIVVTCNNQIYKEPLTLVLISNLKGFMYIIMLPDEVKEIYYL